MQPSSDSAASVVPAASDTRQAEPTPDNIRELVDTFYQRVRADALLGPIFETAVAGHWDEHMPKMVAFWSSLVLGAKQYRGNVQQAHAPLPGIEPRHFSHWLYLFLDTVESRYQPAAAVRFMEPALRIAQSLQLSRFGWDYQIPAEQQALLDRVAPRRPRDDSGQDDHHGQQERRRVEARSEPFPAKIIGRGTDE